MKPFRILFVCHGNICRSAMAEFIMKNYVKKEGLENEIIVSSAGTSNEEEGNDMYGLAKKKLDERSIPYGSHTARRINALDYQNNDLLVGFDFMNVANLNRAYNNDPENKIVMLLKRNIEDPWYTDDFEMAYNDIDYGCSRLIADIIKKEHLK